MRVLRKSSSSELVNSTLVLPAYALARFSLMRKSLTHRTPPSEKAYIRARILPYLSKSPAYIFTTFPSMREERISFTFFPNYLASPLRHSGVSTPLTRKIKRVGTPWRKSTAFIVSPSVTLTTLVRNMRWLREN